ncbi:DegT/DnrJ/EryC1/StrS family aminotransferase [Vreelandella zhuhanensis]|uniref:DegT/DnrJ/EryC1/StrS family aminotransferase n=1 Tax=Vreelandella zhuhanensis TaxID=2684210 RepID=UPI001D0FD200|nr:DegT/DnrJ/EryC1/StrS family aminotransferase [Halomonas zhuhanensis]
MGTRLENAIQTVLAHGRFVLGPEVETLEHRLAARVGVAHCISCASGTDALQIALMALDIGPGDEVIVPGFSFIATAESVMLTGATPVYVDIEPHTCLIDPSAIEAAVTPRTRAIMPVSLFGQCADMQAIEAISERHGLVVIEDGAQSFGAARNGRVSGALSRIACTSFFPSKPLGAYGDGGALFTDDDDLAETLRLIGRHGEARRYHHVRLGMTSRLDTLQAAILLAKLELFDEEIILRRTVAERYDRLLAPLAIECPMLLEGNTSVHAQYSIQLSERDRIQARLSETGIPTMIHYLVPLNRQPAVADTSCSLPVCETVCERILSLPMHPYLQDAQQRQVVKALEKIL